MPLGPPSQTHPAATGERGAASVEHVALATLIGLAVIAAAAALVAAPPDRASRGFGALIARRIACAPRLPDPCHRDPLVLAYGRPLARVVRGLAPASGLSGSEGLLPVDFRRCRLRRCAVPGAGSRGEWLSRSNRRATIFTEVRDRRRAGGGVEVVYWLYRPGLGWRAVSRRVSPAVVRGAAPVPRGPIALVPLETLAGRDHHRFRAGERPSWQWLVP